MDLVPNLHPHKTMVCYQTRENEKREDEKRKRIQEYSVCLIDRKCSYIYTLFLTRTVTTQKEKVMVKKANKQ